MRIDLDNMRLSMVFKWNNMIQGYKQTQTGLYKIDNALQVVGMI